MRILIFSWRDIKNPKSGGAEVLTQELAKRWIRKGHEVSLVSAKFPGGKNQETIDKIKVFRPTAFYRYSPFAYLFFILKTIRFYQKKLKGQYDVIIDQVHGLPFFTPLYTKERVVLFPLEVACDIWRLEVPFPFWVLGWLLEFAYIKLFGNLPFLTISNSTAKDLKKFGVKNVKIITPGISLKKYQSVPKKSQSPILISLGRLTPMKRLEHALEAFSLVCQKFPQAKLFVIGRPSKDYLENLKRKSRELGIDKKVIFTGFISEKEKQKLLSDAWILVSTSLREGFGLNVIEAAACGTPAVVYRVPGLVDSVRDGKTGIICQLNSPGEMAKNLTRILSDNQFRLQLAKNALEYSRKFDWEKKANEGLIFLKKIAFR